MERKFKDIIISSINPNADTVLILSHGGYTPEKGCFRSGSGYVTIPIGITMEFNSEEDRPSIGTKAGHLLEGYPIDPIETVSSGHVIHNYSLSHNPLFDRYRPNDTYDLIKISENGKAHIQDVFRAIHSLNLKYKVIRSFHCRINKSTYKF